MYVVTRNHASYLRLNRVLPLFVCGFGQQLVGHDPIRGNSIFTDFKGALTEQYVLQQLLLRHVPYYFSKANSQLEIDFLIEADGKVIPIEVKAEENLRAKSLRQFVADNNSTIAYMVSMSAYRKEEWLTNIPLYCVQII